MNMLNPNHKNTLMPGGQTFERVLITNDDGIDATGIRVMQELAAAFAKEVWVVAPGGNRSGASQSVSLHRQIGVQKRTQKSYAVDGTPSDCVLLAVYELMPEKPDLIISGINEGINIGDAVGLSGTLGAALTGALFDIPAVAISQAYRKLEEIDWQVAGKYLPGILTGLKADLLPKGMAININLPAARTEEIKGVVNASMNQQTLVCAKVETAWDECSELSFRMKFEHDYKSNQTPTSDVTALRNKSISVSFIEREDSMRGLNPELFQLLSQSAELQHT